ncbi:MAG TPA: hypothetical protein VLZ30_10485, partial [Verrucomicrobiae bacterium]|nr:hypothetical protein [Verrucomicrobiae bacterium]
MIRYGQDEGRQSSPCWEGDAKVQALRVELADGHACLVPYSRIALVDCEYGVDHSTLCLRSDTHEIRIVGKNLRRLECELQKFEVAWVKAAPARYELDASDN